MKILLRSSVYITVFFFGLLLPDVMHAATNTCDADGVQASGAIYRICMPAGAWNGDLVIFAHGYVSPNEEIAIPEDQLVLSEDLTVPELANGLGYAFATTSFSVNGLAVRQGLEDLLDLVDIFRNQYGEPGQVYLIGASQGGSIAALALEQSPDVYDGGLAACGPVGDFLVQLNYWGDVHVIFDYLFPDLLPGDATNIPVELMQQWDDVYAPLVESQLRLHPGKLAELMNVAKIPHDPLDWENNIQAVLGILWYNVFATNDGIAKLGGVPFDNRARVYRGSANDILLNAVIPRYAADPAALQEVHNFYQTQGTLENPLVLIHSNDPIIPFWHESIYRFKVAGMSNLDLHASLPILNRYGHCNFDVVQLLVAFVLLVHEVTDQVEQEAVHLLQTSEEQEQYATLLRAQMKAAQFEHSLHLPAIKARN